MTLAWWFDWTSWQGWGWPGWVAFAAVGAVGALAVLGWQAWMQSKQIVGEAAQRRQDEQRRREDFQFEHTPLITASGTATVHLGDQQNLTVGLELRAAGYGVAYNVIANLRAIDSHAPIGQPVVVSQMRPGDVNQLVFTYTAADIGRHWAQALPHQVQLEVGFYNMFSQRLVFTHTCRVGAPGIEITDPPTFTWPWEFASR